MSFTIVNYDGAILNLFAQMHAYAGGQVYQHYDTGFPQNNLGPNVFHEQTYRFQNYVADATFGGSLIVCPRSGTLGNPTTFIDVTKFKILMELIDHDWGPKQNIQISTAPGTWYDQAYPTLLSQVAKINIFSLGAVECFPTIPTRPIDGSPILSAPSPLAAMWILMTKDNGGTFDEYTPVRSFFTDGLSWDNLYPVVGGSSNPDLPFVLKTTIKS